MTHRRARQQGGSDDPLLIAAARLEADIRTSGATAFRTRADKVQLISMADTCRQMIARLSARAVVLRKDMDAGEKRLNALTAYGAASQLAPNAKSSKQ